MRRGIYRLGAIALTMALVAGHLEGASVPNQLIERVEQKDWDVIPRMPNAGPDTVDALEQLASSSDQEVRELVLWCLNEVGGAKARSVFLRALHDSNEDVRDRAITFMHRHHDVADVRPLLKEVMGHTDDYIREQAALIVGEIGQASAMQGLRHADNATQHRQVSRAIQLALARLGDQQSRQVFFKEFENPSVKQALQALKDFTYIRDPREAARLLPLLSDSREALNVGPSHVPYVIRVCDVTVTVADILLQHPFAFDGREQRRYTDEELSAARQIVRSRQR